MKKQVIIKTRKEIVSLLVVILCSVPALTWAGTFYSPKLEVKTDTVVATQGTDVGKSIQLPGVDTLADEEIKVNVTMITINKNANEKIKQQFYERSGGQDTLFMFYDQHGNELEPAYAKELLLHERMKTEMEFVDENIIKEEK
ncbi:MAG: hypothetical protein CSA36_02930 [Draconibacterium sp.]|nr:MAG: hypothetical protein CSA36_02930 [Draconibacterium sp.]